MKTFFIVLVASVLWMQENSARPANGASTHGTLVTYHNTNPAAEASYGLSKRIVRDIEDSTCGCVARVYDLPNYGGRYLSIVQQNAHFTNDFFSDRVESIRIEGKCKWIFYEHSNFLGSVHILAAGYHSSAPNWGGTGNRISSARVLPPKGIKAIVLFEHVNYRGRMEVLTESNGRLPSVEFNDRVSSIIVTGGVWRVYEHDKYRGSWYQLRAGDYPNIHISLNVGDTISSVKLIY